MLLTLWKPAAALGASSLALMWATLAPAPSQAPSNLKSAAQMLDRNHHGVIKIDEFMRDASDPAVEKMHHSHMGDSNGKPMTAAHGQLMMAGNAAVQVLRKLRGALAERAAARAWDQGGSGEFHAGLKRSDNPFMQ